MHSTDSWSCKSSDFMSFLIQVTMSTTSWSCRPNYKGCQGTSTYVDRAHQPSCKSSSEDRSCEPSRWHPSPSQMVPLLTSLQELLRLVEVEEKLRVTYPKQKASASNGGSTKPQGAGTKLPNTDAQWNLQIGVNNKIQNIQWKKRKSKGGLKLSKNKVWAKEQR